MAIDATGTPTPLGIPKFNTAVDAPSGKGGNAQMDAIDTLIAATVTKPSGIVSGEAAIWNGTTFVRSSTTPLTANGITGIHVMPGNITISAANTDIAWGGGSASLTSYNIGTGGGTLRTLGIPTAGTGARAVLRNVSTAITVKNQLAGGTGAMMYCRGGVDATIGAGEIFEFVYDGGSWVEIARDVTTASGPTVTAATTPPGSPVAGDIWDYTGLGTGGLWRFVYYPGMDGTYPWEFIGGAPAYTEVATDETQTATGAWGDLATTGPEIVVARNGVYDVTGGAQIASSGNPFAAQIGIAIGAGTPAGSGGPVADNLASNTRWNTGVAKRRATAVGTNALRMRYFTDTNPTHYQARWIEVTPVRVA